MIRREVIEKLNTIYADDENSKAIALQYLEDNIDTINKYESLYPIVGASGKCYLKYIPTLEEYKKLAKKEQIYGEANTYNLKKYGFLD